MKKQKAVRRKTLKCCLCGTVIHDPRLSCDPYPVAQDGRCCSRCDDLKVTPARLTLKGIPEEEAKVIGRNIHSAVKFARKRWLESHDNTTAPA